MQIVIKDKDGNVRAQSQGEKQVVLAWEGEYAEGDRILFQVSKSRSFYLIRVDDALEEAYVFLTQNTLLYEIPFGGKKSAHNPKCFTGDRHYLTLRQAESFEIGAYKNLAKNPMDQHMDRGCFPHAWANVETRGEAVFAARNAIDGVVANLSHGKWPYESWGINQQDDAQFTLEFGRPVDIDTILLYTRADFPHDNWWVQANLTFSDGTSCIWELEKQDTPHALCVKKKKLEWIRLDKLIKAEDPSPFPALTQIEVYGTETAR